MQRPVYGPYQSAPIQPPYGGLSPKAQMERDGIQRAALGVGAAFLLFYAAQFILQFLLMGVLLLCGNDVNETYEILMEPGVLYVQQIALSALVFTLPFALSARIARRRVGEVVRLGKVPAGVFVPLVLVGLGMCMLGNQATNLLAQTLSWFHLVPVQPELEDPAGGPGMMLVILGSAFLPALVEEFAFRGVMLGLLRPYGDGFAILLSAVFFGLMHGNLVQAPFAIVVGAGLGYITVASGSMWPAIAAHFFNNLLATLLNNWAVGWSPATAGIADNLFALVFFTAGLLGAALYVGKRPAAFRLHPSSCELPGRGRYGAYFSHPMTIIVLCLFGFMILLAQLGG